MHVTIDLNASGSPGSADGASVAPSSHGADDDDKPRSDAEKVSARAARASPLRRDPFRLSRVTPCRALIYPPPLSPHTRSLRRR